MNTSSANKLTVELDGRDYIEVGSLVPPFALKIVGCAELLNLVQSLKKQFGKDIRTWPLPTGIDHSSLLVKELILKCQGKWKLPYEHDELCHCRAVPTRIVDQAIVAGAHTPEVVSRQTSASTACSTCRPDVERLIAYRLGQKN